MNLLKLHHSGEITTSDVYAGDAHPICVGNTLKIPDEKLCQDGLPDIDNAVITGRLKNSQGLGNLDPVVGHLPAAERTGLIALFTSFQLRWETLHPVCTSWSTTWRGVT